MFYFDFEFGNQFENQFHSITSFELVNKDDESTSILNNKEREPLLFESSQENAEYVDIQMNSI